MRSGDGYVIVYSITSTTSFLEANGFREQLYRVLDKDLSDHVSIALVGNKCDLETERQVVKEEAQKLADEWKVLFFETSAKNKINITETFQALVKDIKAHREVVEPEPAQGGSSGKTGKTPGKKPKCALM